MTAPADLRVIGPASHEHGKFLLKGCMMKDVLHTEAIAGLSLHVVSARDETRRIKGNRTHTPSSKGQWFRSTAYCILLSHRVQG